MRNLFFLFFALLLSACLPDSNRPSIEPPRPMSGPVQSISSDDIEQIRDTSLRQFLLSKIEEAALHDSFRLDSTFPTFRAYILAGPILQPNQKTAIIGYSQADNPEYFNIKFYTWDNQRRSYVKGSPSGYIPFLKRLDPQIGDINADGINDVYLPITGDKHGYLFLGTPNGDVQMVTDYVSYSDIQFNPKNNTFYAKRQYTEQYTCPSKDNSKRPKQLTCKTTFILTQTQGIWELQETSRDCPCPQ